MEGHVERHGVMGNKKLIGAVAVTGGVLALGSTAVAFAGDGGQNGGQPAEVRPASAQQQSDQPYTGPDPDEIYTGPGEHYTGPDPDEIRTGPDADRAHPHRGNPWPEHCSTGQPSVDEKQAERIALKKVPGASVTEIDLDRCYGVEWELDLRKGNTEYEVEINADNGQIVSFEEDTDD
ncbi:PepSY domain-containing protein [Salinifilum ghardaiensis]